VAADTPDPATTAPAVSRADVASGAALSGLARMGAIIEIVTQPAFVWMFGSPPMAAMSCSGRQ